MRWVYQIGKDAKKCRHSSTFVGFVFRSCLNHCCHPKDGRIVFHRGHRQSVGQFRDVDTFLGQLDALGNTEWTRFRLRNIASIDRRRHCAARRCSTLKGGETSDREREKDEEKGQTSALKVDLQVAIDMECWRVEDEGEVNKKKANRRSPWCLEFDLTLSPWTTSRLIGLCPRPILCWAFSSCAIQTQSNEDVPSSSLSETLFLLSLCSATLVTTTFRFQTEEDRDESNEANQPTVHRVSLSLFLCSSHSPIGFSSFFGKKDADRRPPVSVENTAVLKSPSSESEETSPVISRTKKSKKRLLSADDEEKSDSPKQMKVEVKEENRPTVSLEQKRWKIAGCSWSSTEICSSVVELQLYNPGKKDYDPMNDACWKLGERWFLLPDLCWRHCWDCFSVPYSALASTLLLIEETSARLEIIRILSNFFRSVISLSSNDLLHCVYLCVNKVAPDYDGIELGIGETIILKAIADSTGRTLEQLKVDYKSRGDLGLVAEVSEERGVKKRETDMSSLRLPERRNERCSNPKHWRWNMFTRNWKRSLNWQETK